VICGAFALDLQVIPWPRPGAAQVNPRLIRD
jgi:hypothetical protein